MICTGFGHRYLPDNLQTTLDQTILALIRSHNVNIFYTGGMGDFDREFAAAVCRARRTYPEVQLILVRPYPNKTMLFHQEVYDRLYTRVIIPKAVAGLHYKAAIPARNRWMVEQADVVLSGVYKDSGGAYKTLCYAKQIGKPIVNVIKKEPKRELE